MVIQPPQRNVEGFLHVVRLASVLVGAPEDVDLMGDRMPRYGVVTAIEFNVTFSVVGHSDFSLAVGQKRGSASRTAG